MKSYGYDIAFFEGLKAVEKIARSLWIMTPMHTHKKNAGPQGTCVKVIHSHFSGLEGKKRGRQERKKLISMTECVGFRVHHGQHANDLLML